MIVIKIDQTIEKWMTFKCGRLQKIACYLFASSHPTVRIIRCMYGFKWQTDCEWRGGKRENGKEQTHELQCVRNENIHLFSEPRFVKLRHRKLITQVSCAFAQSIVRKREWKKYYPIKAHILGSVHMHMHRLRTNYHFKQPHFHSHSPPSSSASCSYHKHIFTWYFKMKSLTI